ncbi:MAG: hypothetical protein J5851_06950 [Oscillospiraceae bacterium]|nr:hypothetical protein [Oscillospiraceae bacterium]
MEYGWEPLNIADRCIYLGLVSDPPQDTSQSSPHTDGVIAWIWLPKHYLQADTAYSVW